MNHLISRTSPRKKWCQIVHLRPTTKPTPQVNIHTKSTIYRAISSPGPTESPENDRDLEREASQGQFSLQTFYLDIESSIQCSLDALTLYDGKTTTSPYVQGITGRVCGSSYDSAGYSTLSSFLTLTFFSNSAWNEKGFEMIITSFHAGHCYSGEYKCSNGRCIPDDIACNGYNPCNDYSDCPLSAGAIAGIVIGCVAFCGVVVTVIVLLLRRHLNRTVTPFQSMIVTSDYCTSTS